MHDVLKVGKFDVHKYICPKMCSIASEIKHQLEARANRVLLNLSPVGGKQIVIPVRFFDRASLKPKVLIIDDNVSLTSVLSDLLSADGFECAVANDGEIGLAQALSGNFQFLILDLSLPGINGLDVCSKVKERLPDLPVLVLTAKTAESEAVASLEVGADDYVQKPFRPKELIARVRTRLREFTKRQIDKALQDAEHASQRQTIIIGDLKVDFNKKQVFKKGNLVKLSAKEYRAVALLAGNPGHTYDRDELLRSIWQFYAKDYELNVSVLMSRLRNKLEDNPRKPRYILTVRGLGYRFAES